jgi:hypothetical protein
MTIRMRSWWIVAAIAVAVTSGELAAYQGVAPRVRAALSIDRGATLLRAGAVVARNLPSLAAQGAQRVAGALALGAVRQTSQLYRLALGVAPQAGESDCPLAACSKASAAACARASTIRVIETTCARVGAAQCAAPICPPGCPASACPRSPSKSSAAPAAAWTGMTRAIVIFGI